MHLTIRSLLFPALVTVFLLAACNKHTPGVTRPNTPPDSSSNPGLPPKDTSTAIVYVFGMTGGDSVVCWKNGVPTLLAHSPELYGWGMTAVDSDIYIAAGFGPADSTATASYWKNGQQVTLPLSPGAIGATATGIFISDSDVYVSGTMHFNDPTSVPFTPRWGFTACYWKNGQLTLLQDWEATVNYFGYLQAVRSNYTTGIWVSGSDVYVSGGERYPIVHSLPFHFAGYWKNGLFVDLPNYLTDSNVTTQVPEPTTGAIVMNGTDLYVAGNQLLPRHYFPSALYWDNGALISLQPDSGEYSRGIQASGNDLYSVGSYFLTGADHAAYWKDTTKALVDSSIYPSDGYSIFVSGKDIYVAGIKAYTGIGYPVYWKNGQQKTLGKNGTAYAILVRY